MNFASLNENENIYEKYSLVPKIIEHATTSEDTTSAEESTSIPEAPVVPGYTFSHNGYWDGFTDVGETNTVQDCADICTSTEGCLAFNRGYTDSKCYIYTTSNFTKNPDSDGQPTEHYAYFRDLNLSEEQQEAVNEQTQTAQDKADAAVADAMSKLDEMKANGECTTVDGVTTCSNDQSTSCTTVNGVTTCTDSTSSDTSGTTDEEQDEEQDSEEQDSEDDSEGGGVSNNLVVLIILLLILYLLCKQNN